jgi:hypothetical protein
MEGYEHIQLPLFKDVINKSSKYSSFVKVHVAPDGSCFFHAVLSAISETYNTEEKTIRNEYGDYQVVRIDKTSFVVNERARMSKLLASPISNVPGAKTYYEILSSGYYKNEGSKAYPELYSLEAMQRVLMDPIEFIGLEFLEFISLIYDIDIYILYDENKDIYVTGNSYDSFYKGRNSIVLIYSQAKEHFDVIGLWHDNGISDYFTPDNSFIKALRKRYKKLHSSQK